MLSKRGLDSTHLDLSLNSRSEGSLISHTLYCRDTQCFCLLNKEGLSLRSSKTITDACRSSWLSYSTTIQSQESHLRGRLTLSALSSTTYSLSLPRLWTIFTPETHISLMGDRSAQSYVSSQGSRTRTVLKKKLISLSWLLLILVSYLRSQSFSS